MACKSQLRDLVILARLAYYKPSPQDVVHVHVQREIKLKEAINQHDMLDLLDTLDAILDVVAAADSVAEQIRDQGGGNCEEQALLAALARCKI
jgi:hypothetical protein